MRFARMSGLLRRGVFKAPADVGLQVGADLTGKPEAGVSRLRFMVVCRGHISQADGGDGAALETTARPVAVCVSFVNRLHSAARRAD